MSWITESNRLMRSKISGVYAIINNVDGGMYIGSSKNIGKRIKKHLEFCRDVKGSQGSYNLHCAVSKYGIENFSIRVIELCELSDLLEREAYWINKLQPSYNVWMNPANLLGSRNDSKLKPKELWKPCGKHPQKEETRKKISETMKGRKPTEQCLKKAQMLHKKKVLLECIKTAEGKVFNSLTECADYLGISIKHASLIKHDKTLFRKQFRIKDYVQMA